VAYKSPPLLAGDYSATFTTALMLKDVDLGLDLCPERWVDAPGATHLRALREPTAAAGHADEDFMALYLRLRHSLAGASNRDSDEVTTR
jgi:3-hydroxyisobutyrate dehydrogenase